MDFWSMKFEEYLTEYVYNGAEPPDPEEGLDEEVEMGGDQVQGHARQVEHRVRRRVRQGKSQADAPPLKTWAEMTARRRSWTRFRSRDHRSTGVQISGRFT